MRDTKGQIPSSSATGKPRLTHRSYMPSPPPQKQKSRKQTPFTAFDSYRDTLWFFDDDDDWSDSFFFEYVFKEEVMKLHLVMMQ
jgi:hypothetical protein